MKTHPVTVSTSGSGMYTGGRASPEIQQQRHIFTTFETLVIRRCDTVLRGIPLYLVFERCLNDVTLASMETNAAGLFVLFRNQAQVF